MPQGRIQPRTWLVEFGLAVSAASVMDRSEHEHLTEVPPTDAEIKRCFMDVMDKSNRDGRRIRCLQLVSFAYESRDPTMAAVDTMQNPTDNQSSTVDVVGFARYRIHRRYDYAFMDSRPSCHRPAVDASLHKKRHWQQLEAAGYHQEFLL